MVKILRSFSLLMVILMLVSNSLWAQTVQAGISANGNILTISAKPDADFIANYESGIVTITWSSGYGVTLGTPSDTTGNWAASSSGTLGGNSYTIFSFSGASILLTWTNGSINTLFTVPVNQTGSGFGQFSLATPSFVTGSDWQFVVSPGTDITNHVSFYYNSSTGTDVPLPVELTNCMAVANRLNTELKWTTATETNNFGFDIERKAVSTQLSAVSVWTKIGFVPGNGTSTTPRQYSYVDEDLATGSYDYRIKQIDKSGSFKYSTVMQVEIGNVPQALTLANNYPNPFNPSTSLEFTVPNDGWATLKVYNSIGEEVATLFDAQATAGRIVQARFDASRLPSGAYFARLQYDGKSLMTKMLFMK